jgi:hypothetical protein
VVQTKDSQYEDDLPPKGSEEITERKAGKIPKLVERSGCFSVSLLERDLFDPAREPGFAVPVGLLFLFNSKYVTAEIKSKPIYMKKKTLKMLNGKQVLF